MDLSFYIYAVLLGIVQGITEWLPISSTGHMIIVSTFLPVTLDKDFLDFFLVAVQFFSMLAVLILYFDRINPFIKDKEKRKDVLGTWLKIGVAVLPAGIIGLCLGDYIEEKLFNVFTVTVALIVYGILFIVFEKIKKNKNVLSIDTLPLKKAFFIGCFQSLALIPGTSRSGATIFGAKACGMDDKSAAEFSFLLALPTMAGASLIKFLKYGFSFSSKEYLFLLVGGTVAFIVSVFSVSFLLKVVKNRGFAPFGYYRIALGILLLIINCK